MTAPMTVVIMYLIISSVTNIGLDLLFVGVFMLVHTSIWTDFAGIIIIIVIALTQKFGKTEPVR